VQEKILKVHINGLEERQEVFNGERMGSMDLPVNIGGNPVGENYSGWLWNMRFSPTCVRDADVNRWLEDRFVLEKEGERDNVWRWFFCFGKILGGTAPDMEGIKLDSGGDDVVLEKVSGDGGSGGVGGGGGVAGVGNRWHFIVKPIYLTEKLLEREIFTDSGCSQDENDEKKTLKAFLKEIYCVGNIIFDGAIVNYVNEISHKKKFGRDIFTKGWGDISPVPEDLTRSPLLRKISAMSYDEKVSER